MSGETPEASIDPSRVVVSTVFECKSHYGIETVMLYRSLDANGGRLAEARRRAHCVGPLDPEIGRDLRSMSVDVVMTDALIDDYPHANKIRMFEQWDDEEVLVALDTDVCVAGDFLDWIDATAVAVKPVDRNPLTLEQWERLFTYFGLELPRFRYRTHFDADLVVPYYNTGVVMFPSRWLAGFTPVWERYTRELWGNYPNIGCALDSLRFFTDQYAFALALEEVRLPTAALPLALNFPTHQPIHDAFRPNAIEPLLVHHHHRREGEQVLPGDYSGPNRAIDKVNSGIDSRGRRGRRWRAMRSWATNWGGPQRTSSSAASAPGSDGRPADEL